MASTKSCTPSSRRGLDPWLTANDVDFSIWDQWFLTLLFVVHDGAWPPLRDQLRANRQEASFRRDDAEAKLSHLSDLENRWTALADVGHEQLRRECQDPQLLRRARAKILEQQVAEHEKTRPMRETPRRRLRERALRGYWTLFPVSPACYEPSFEAIIQSRDFYSERASFGLARRLRTVIERALRRTTGPAECVAVLRVFLTSVVLAMDRADDSCGILGDLAWEQFPKYFAAPWREAGLSLDIFYRDFLEYAVWEDYGLLGANGVPSSRA